MRSGLEYSSAVDIIVLGEKIHGFQHFVSINEWADNNQAAQNTPQPEGACAEIIGNTSACQLVANSIGDPVTPNKRNDAESQPGKDKHDQAIVLGLFAIVSACNRVDVRADRGHYNQTINAKGNQR